MKASHYLKSMYGIGLAIVLVLVALASIYVHKFPLALVMAGVFAVFLEYIIAKTLMNSNPNIKSAVITGIIIGAVAPFNAQIYIVAVACIVAISSKYALRYKSSNIFNPAALGLLVALFLFNSSDQWWVASYFTISNITFILTPLLLIVAYKAKRFTTAASFIVVTGVLIFLTSPNTYVLSNIPIFFIGAQPFFFGSLMATDPKTSPHIKEEQLAYGIGLALLGFGISLYGAPYPDIVALLAANAAFLMFKEYKSRHHLNKARAQKDSKLAMN